MGYDLLRLTPSARKICSENGNLRCYGQVSPGIRPWEGLHLPGLADIRARAWNLSSTGASAKCWASLILPPAQRRDLDPAHRWLIHYVPYVFARVRTAFAGISESASH